MSTKRTQLYMPPTTYRTLETLARQRQTSVASLVREAVARYLHDQPVDLLVDGDPLWQMLGSVEGHQADGAEKHDEYLYGSSHSKPSRSAGKGPRR